MTDEPGSNCCEETVDHDIVELFSRVNKVNNAIVRSLTKGRTLTRRKFKNQSRSERPRIRFLLSFQRQPHRQLGVVRPTISWRNSGGKTAIIILGGMQDRYFCEKDLAYKFF
jgi:hypothetical protein